MNYDRLGVALAAVQNALTDDLRASKYQGHPNPLAGHCYVASEALWHLGARELGFWPHHMRVAGESHWYLSNEYGTVVDPTVGQFATIPVYRHGQGKGFLTSQPSKRAAIVIARVLGV